MDGGQREVKLKPQTKPQKMRIRNRVVQRPYDKMQLVLVKD